MQLPLLCKGQGGGGETPSGRGATFWTDLMAAMRWLRSGFNGGFPRGLLDGLMGRRSLAGPLPDSSARPPPSYVLLLRPLQHQ